MAHRYLSICKVICLSIYTHGEELLFLRYIICACALWNLLTALVIFLKLYNFLTLRKNIYENQKEK